MRKEAGFTLIELIAVMVILGIVATVVSFTAPFYIQSFMFARDNQAESQKTQIALARISRELGSLLNVTQVQTAPTSITFTRLSNDHKSIMAQVIAQSGSLITLTSNGGPANTLLDDVTAFTLSYYKDGTTVWTFGTDPINLLSTITVSLTVNGINTGNSTFSNVVSTTVSLRNNGNAGGTPPPTSESKPKTSYPGCFVATAACGSENHPIVVILRDFRDRFLLKWEIGRAFIEEYYTIGPHLADLIRNRPCACFAVRLLLSPLAGMVFLFMYFPAAIPVILIFSCVGVHLAGRALSMRRKSPIGIASDQKGAVLITVIVVITVLAVLIAAMASFIPISNLSQIEGSASMKARYLAEAGYRYASSVFLNAGSGLSGAQVQAAKFQNLITLNSMNGTSAVKVGANGADGRFELSVTPYFLVFNPASPSTNYPAGTTTVQLQYPGQTPPGTEYSLPSPGQFYYLTDPGNTPNITSYTKNGNSFTLNPGTPTTVYAGNSLCFVTSLSNAVTINQGGSLQLDSTAQAGPFPPYHGTFIVTDSNGHSNGYTYKYDFKSAANGTALLTNITNQDPANPGNGLPLTINSKTDTNASHIKYIVCNEFIKLSSKGEVYTESNLQSINTATYYTPIGLISLLNNSNTIATTTDTMSNLNNWDTNNAAGSVNTSTTTNKYMQMGGDTHGAYGDSTMGEVAQKAQDFTRTWVGQNYLLSYDAQVKINVGSNSNYMAGISFRIQPSSGYSYGLSFINGNNNTSLWTTDGIPNGLIPNSSLINKALVVLWKNTTNGGFEWLAYKDLSRLPSTFSGQKMVDSTGKLISQWATLLVRISEQYDTGTSGSKHNLIRCYYGSTATSGTPNSVMTDENRAQNPHWPDTGPVSPAPYWPPDNATTWGYQTSPPPNTTWNSSTDQYTLIDWDGVNPDTTVSTSSAEMISPEAGCVIRDSSWLTASSGSNLGTPEVGLHVAGNIWQCFIFCWSSAITVGFDDFAMRYFGGTSVSQGFITPIEQ